MRSILEAVEALRFQYQPRSMKHHNDAVAFIENEVKQKKFYNEFKDKVLKAQRAGASFMKGNTSFGY